jgi:hypothetical protein
MSDSGWKDRGLDGLGCLIALAFIAYGLLIIAVGWIGIEEEFGYWWGIAALVLALFLRFTLPITIGAIFGAMHLWDWHWIGASMFALPGLAFMIPAVFAMILSLFKKQ